MKEINLLKHFDEIERYLDGLMDEEERLRFEKQLQTDAELSEAFDKHNSIYKALTDDEMIDFRRKLSRAMDDEDRTRKNFIRLNTPIIWMWIAAGFIILIGLSFLINRYILDRQSISNERLAHVHDGKFLTEQKYQLTEFYFELKKMVVRGEAFRLIHPPDSIVLRREMKVHFNWITQESTHLSFVLTDRNGNELQSLMLEHQDSFKLRMDWDPGIYFYQFKRQDELLYLGVLFISE